MWPWIRAEGSKSRITTAIIIPPALPSKKEKIFSWGLPIRTTQQAPKVVANPAKILKKIMLVILFTSLIKYKKQSINYMTKILKKGYGGYLLEIKRSREMEEEIKRARSLAYKLLSHRWYTKKEMKESLLNKGFSLETVRIVLEELEKDKYLDDQRIIEIWLEGRAERKLLGKTRLRQELMQKGISSELIDFQLEERLSEEREWQLALMAARKKRVGIECLEREKYLRRMYAYLQRKGFSINLIKKVLQELEEEGKED